MTLAVQFNIQFYFKALKLFFKNINIDFKRSGKNCYSWIFFVLTWPSSQWIQLLNSICFVVLYPASQVRGLMTLGISKSFEHRDPDLESNVCSSWTVCPYRDCFLLDGYWDCSILSSCLLRFIAQIFVLQDLQLTRNTDKFIRIIVKKWTHNMYS